ncbi:MAG: hydrolase, partial [Bacteroidales bacterium]|nr:hydrolase [Bacteroidales bacterium]
HHGTSCTRYFYNQYIEAGGDPDAAKDFFYPGKKPSSVEQVILMICDSVEAASRTLRDHSPETISQFVENIVEGKIREGQLSEGNISIRDLGTVKEALKTYLAGVYHERIEYPTEETNNQQ